MHEVLPNVKHITKSYIDVLRAGRSLIDHPQEQHSSRLDTRFRIGVDGQALNGSVWVGVGDVGIHSAVEHMKRRNQKAHMPHKLHDDTPAATCKERLHWQ